MESEYTKERALGLLSAEGDALEDLYRHADMVRRNHMGEEVFIRGIVEFSNICLNDCLYCGIRASNRDVARYAIPPEEIVDIAHAMKGSEQTTVVLQSGETPGMADDKLGSVIRRIKGETGLAVTVSVGNRPYETYRFWKECGMDRYLLRFETSDRALFARLRPGSSLDERLRCLGHLKDLGVQTGSGFMIGLPGERPEVLADNIILCRSLDLDMIGIGPFIPHPGTPLRGTKNAYHDDPEMFFKALAVLRVFNPDAHIPATTAFDAVFPGSGRDLALKRGANVFMPNNTPVRYKKEYLLYPGKPSVDESPEECTEAAVARIESLGRIIGKGPGHSFKKRPGRGL
ncbi:MAG TPA: [FeFe] hydrogenase H-cluster radical SAM maturase HydE [Syntrophorhabdaceae bacterium]|nr:[FeFe] hydrogenase H-cluster radical SAM maturase HydE [Syntrophorhabdaceae bacterium]